MKTAESAEVTSGLLGIASGLAARFFAVDTEDGHARTTLRSNVLFVLDGHIADWSEWSELLEEDACRFARLLRRRPNQLANTQSTGELLDRFLLDGRIAGCTPHENYKDDKDGMISVDPGMPLTAFIDQQLRKLDEIHTERKRELPVAEAGAHTTTIRVPGPDGSDQTYIDLRFELQEHHEQRRVTIPVVEDAPPLADHWVSFSELEEIAKQIDAGQDEADPTTYRQDCVRRFAQEIRTDADENITGLLLTAGTLNELLAYTGFGKSVVLVESFACWAVDHGVSVAFVLPSNGDVVRVTHQIERALAIVCPRREAKLVPLVSPRSMIKVAENAATRISPSGPDADWIWKRFGYGCGLAALATTESAVDGWQPGREPCAKLRRPRPRGKKAETVACPWRTTCGRYRAVRAACSADIIVTSHANLMRGVLQAPVEDGRGPNDRLTVEELVLRRCQVVVIDEIDLFQKSAIDHSGRGLLLDYAGRTNTPLREFDADFGAAFGRLHSDIDANVRDAYFGLRYLSENYVSHLAYGRIGAISPAKRRQNRGPYRFWIVPRRWDNWLTAKLFGVESGEVSRTQMEMFRSLFVGEKSVLPGEPAKFAPVREALAAMVTGGLGGRAVTEAHLAVHDLASTLPEADRARITNLIMRRAILERARFYLHRLMANNAQLMDIGVESAQRIADALGTYGQWRVTPTGPLNRLVFAFTEYYDDTGNEPPQLSTAAFGGDPHTYVVTLGDTTALAHAETRRIILGLSATAYFPGAPHHHVHVKPKWWVPDNNPGTVRIVRAPVENATGDLLRISGLDGAERVLATKQLAERLWVTHLAAELESLKNQDRDRARVLLATTSYVSARHVAEGLADAGVGSHRICLAVPPSEAEHSTDVINTGRWHEIPADRLELFSEMADADILIAPLARVQRGVNIIGKGDKSALGSIWLIVRPIPLIDEPAELLAHIQAKALAEHPGPSSSPIALLAERRQAAGTYLEEIIHRPPYFQAQPLEVKLGVIAEIMNGAIQLVGRARRGGTPAVLHLVDGAMLEGRGGTDMATLIDKQRTCWRAGGQLPSMESYYDTTLREFFDYADQNLEGAVSC